jgi:HD-GYP domain-containing protein (c-di-GMP phosphodiesterase class II)
VEIYSSIFDDADHINRENPNLDDDRKSIKSLISIINSRDRYTYNHIERVVYYCQVFADYLRLINEDKRKLIYGAYLHDLGKINISKEILISSKPLTEPEWDEVKKHPGDSADIIRQMGGMENIIPVVLQHHEKYDGTGYPNQLKGEKIHYLARILTVADSFDAMTNKRPYQEKRTFEEAFEEIRRNKGIHFDPVLAEQFIKAIENMK